MGMVSGRGATRRAGDAEVGDDGGGRDGRWIARSRAVVMVFERVVRLDANARVGSSFE